MPGVPNLVLVLVRVGAARSRQCVCFRHEEIRMARARQASRVCVRWLTSRRTRLIRRLLRAQGPIFLFFFSLLFTHLVSANTHTHTQTHSTSIHPEIGVRGQQEAYVPPSSSFSFILLPPCPNRDATPLGRVLHSLGYPFLPGHILPVRWSAISS